MIAFYLLLSVWLGGACLSYVFPSWVHVPGWFLGLHHSCDRIWEWSRLKMREEGKLSPRTIELVIVCVCLSWPPVFIKHTLEAPRFAYRYWRFVLKRKGSR